ncbi:MAG: mechanosensitive ion channel [Elusimicrobia bacterium]|nr:mechanosensitive ion channel [Elusimicrobiota bacterium]
MTKTWRAPLAASLAALLAAPGPVFAGQVAAVLPHAAAPVPAGGTFGVAGLRAQAGLSHGLELGALSGSLRGTSLLVSPTPLVVQTAALVVPTALVPVAVSPVVEAPQTTAPQTAAAPHATAQLEAARSVLDKGTVGEGRTQDPADTKGVWDAFWSRSRFSAAPSDGALTPGADSKPVPLAAAQPAPASKAVVPGPAQEGSQTRGWLRKLAAPLSLAALWGAARFTLPSRLPGFWAKAAPYMSGAGILLAAYAVNGLAQRGVGSLAKRLDWKPGTVTAARLGTSVAVYAVGGAVALHAAGVSTAALLATFGIGGVAMSMAAKDFIGNFLEGVKMLANHPFVVGDRVKIGAQEYTVKDMDLRYLSLARPDGGVTLMTYAQLAEKTVTIFREYAQRGQPGASSLGSLWTSMGRLARGVPRPSLLKASLWTALGLGLAVALPLLPALLPVQALTAWAWLPYAKGAAAMVAAHFLERGAVGFIRRAAEDQGWQPQSAVILKLAVQTGIYLVGGTVALRFFGMTWSALLKSLGATSIAVGWASADLIGNLIQGFWILATHPFAIGDQIEVGAVSGTVADMNLSYVVLEHADMSHTLVPYAVLKASPFTVLSKAPDPAQ